MNLGKAVLAAFVGYFEEVRRARLAFWLKEPVSPNVEFVSGPVTVLVFLMARHSFAGTPSAATYGGLIVAYVVVTALVAGVACLIISPARQPLGENMRKFVSTAWVLSTMAALFSTLDSRLKLTYGFADFLQNKGWDAIDPDVVATCLPSVAMAVIIVGLLENTTNQSRAEGRHYALSVLLLFLAAAVGLGLMIGRRAAS